MMIIDYAKKFILEEDYVEVLGYNMYFRKEGQEGYVDHIINRIVFHETPGDAYVRGEIAYTVEDDLEYGFDEVGKTIKGYFTY